MKTGRKTIRVTAAALAGLTALAAAPAGAGASQTYYERTFMVEAGSKCRLFEPGLAAALNAAAVQARGAAVRAGDSEDALRAVAFRAKDRADAVACASPELGLAATRVREAFDGFSRQVRMTYPGAYQDWSADRASYSRQTWRLSQPSITGKSPVTFGAEAGPDGRQLAAVISFVGQNRPYAARIVLRDVTKSPRPWLGASALPSTDARTAVFATASTAADESLLAKGNKQGEAWTFPAHAADALAGLDPRERFVVEFLFRDDSVARAEFEVGDFAAARAFLAMGDL